MDGQNNNNNSAGERGWIVDNDEKGLFLALYTSTAADDAAPASPPLWHMTSINVLHVTDRTSECLLLLWMATEHR